MTSEFKTVITGTPAAQNTDTDDFHFKIPRNLIRQGVIQAGKYYELWIKEFDVEK